MIQFRRGDMNTCVVLKGMLVTVNDNALHDAKLKLVNVPCSPFNATGFHNGEIDFILNGAFLVPKASSYDNQYHIRVADCYRNYTSNYTYDDYYYLMNIECDVLKELNFQNVTEYLSYVTDMPTTYAEAKNTSDNKTYTDLNVTILSMRLKRSFDDSLPNLPHELVIQDAVIQVNDEVITLTSNNTIRDEQLIRCWTNHKNNGGPRFNPDDYNVDIYWHSQAGDVNNILSDTLYPPDADYDESEIGIANVNTIFGLVEVCAPGTSTSPGRADIHAANLDAVMNR